MRGGRLISNCCISFRILPDLCAPCPICIQAMRQLRLDVETGKIERQNLARASEEQLCRLRSELRETKNANQALQASLLALGTASPVPGNVDKECVGGLPGKKHARKTWLRTTPQGRPQEKVVVLRDSAEEIALLSRLVSGVSNAEGGQRGEAEMDSSALHGVGAQDEPPAAAAAAVAGEGGRENGTELVVDGEVKAVRACGDSQVGLARAHVHAHACMHVCACESLDGLSFCSGIRDRQAYLCVCIA